MSKKKKEVKEHRWCPDPHKRHGVVPNKKTIYSRKGRSKGDPSDILG